jgi:hypothetical protein
VWSSSRADCLVGLAPPFSLNSWDGINQSGVTQPTKKIITGNFFDALSNDDPITINKFLLHNRTV